MRPRISGGDFKFFDEVYKKPVLIPSFIIISSIIILLLNVYGLQHGITYVLPHLFYLPLILTAYYYPHRGVLFAFGLAAVYCAVAMAFVNPTNAEILSALARSAVFVIIASVVSYLSGRMHHDTQMCRRLVSVVKSSGDAIISETPDGIITDWNNGAEQLYGYTAQEMKGTSIINLIPPEQREEKIRRWEKIGMVETVERFETERVAKDGTRIQVSLSRSPIINRFGDIIGVSEISHDITERLRFQNEILKQKDRWKLTFDAVPDLIAIIDSHFRIVQVNKAMAERLGISPEKAVGMRCHDVVHHTSSPLSICPHQLLLRDHQPHSTEIHEDNLDGDFFLTVSPIRDSLGAAQGSVHILHDVTERKRAERALRESEKKFRTIFDTFPDLYYQTDLNGIITTLSPSTKQLSGWEPEELIGHPATKIYPFPEQRARLLEALSRTGEVHGFDITLWNKEGKPIQTSVSAHFVLDDTGKPIAVEGTIRDIDEKKKMEVALQESEEKFRQIFNSASDGIHLYETDEQGLPRRLIDVNDVACRMLQYSRDELLGKNPLDLTTDFSSRSLEQIRDEIQTKGFAIFETEHRRKDGGIVPVEVNAHMVVIQGKKMGLAIIRDLTRRKKDEAALRQLNADHRTMIDHAPAMIFYKDTKNTFLRVNPAGARLFGASVEEMEGKSCYDLFPSLAEKYYQDDREVINSAKPKLGIIEQMNDASGERLWVQTDKIPLFDEQGTVNGILTFVIDITVRKRAEDALALASKKLNLLSSITRHDIRNQLMALNAYIALSEELIDKPTELKEFIDKEKEIAEALARQISFTKDYEDLGVKSAVWHEVSTLIRDAGNSLPMQNIGLDIRCSGLEIFADPLVEKVFYNLIDNSLRYGGAKMTAIRVTMEEPGNNLRIIYEDDGNGVSVEDKKKLFTKGFGKNTGLGLFLSREILSITGITITENGEPGKGVRFEIAVPEGAWRVTVEKQE